MYVALVYVEHVYMCVGVYCVCVMCGVVCCVCGACVTGFWSMSFLDDNTVLHCWCDVCVVLVSQVFGV